MRIVIEYHRQVEQLNAKCAKTIQCQVEQGGE